jgi:2,4-dienoyl-CoA reductase-like NADH-dependent reductase (Old Yellow Enzyme family)
MNEDQIKNQINELIKDEIQEVINEYVDAKDESSKSGVGFVLSDDDKELKVNISQNEIDKIIKEYKKIKKSNKSNLSQVRKLGLVDKYGNPLK